MPKISEYNYTQNFTKALFVGKNGSGKTLAASSYPKPMMIYDFDGRMAPLITWLTESDKNAIEYQTIGVADINQFCRDFVALQDNNPFATIVLDSLTSLSFSLMNYYLNLKGKGSKKEGKLVGMTQVPTWDEINGETALCSQILDVAKVLKCNVIMTAHPVGKMDLSATGNARKTTSIVAFGNKIPTFVPNYFNEIYQFFIESGFNAQNETVPKYVVYTKPNSEEDMMKTALNIPRKIDITNDNGQYLNKLYDIIQKEMK